MVWYWPLYDLYEFWPDYVVYIRLPNRCLELYYIVVHAYRNL